MLAGNKKSAIIVNPILLWMCYMVWKFSENLKDCQWN
jgi:hypothetical protein